MPLLIYPDGFPPQSNGINGIFGSQTENQARSNHIVIFAFFAVFHLGETIKWNTAVAFMLILAAVFFAFYDFSN